MPDWKNDADAQEKLRRLWDQTAPRLSAAEIGVQFQTTKNAIVGAARRLDLTLRATPIKRSNGVRFPPSPRLLIRDRDAASQQIISALVTQKAAPLPVQPIVVASRARDVCCWPFGTPRAPDFRWCGEPLTRPGASYCAEHHVAAYQDKAMQARQQATLPEVEAYAAAARVVPPVASGLMGLIIAVNNHRRAAGHRPFTIAGGMPK